jgi:hypothetical protein
MPLPDGPHNTARPPLVLTTPGHQGETFDIGDDPARYLATPEAMFERPWLSAPGSDVDAFVWPLGTEGFRYSGSSEYGIHKYIGDDEIEVNVIHRDEPHFELNGIFPGNTAPANMRALVAVIRADTTDNGKILHLPYILPTQQWVAVTDYSFSHEEGDRTKTIAYTISFLRMRAGKKQGTGPPNTDPGANPTSGNDTRGDDVSVFVVKEGFRTLRAIAKKVYGSVEEWTKLFNKNEKKLKDKGITRSEAATHQLPLGMKITF